MSTRALLIVLTAVTVIVGLVLMHGGGGHMNLGPLHVSVGH